MTDDSASMGLETTLESTSWVDDEFTRNTEKNLSARSIGRQAMVVATIPIINSNTSMTEDEARSESRSRKEDDVRSSRASLRNLRGAKIARVRTLSGDTNKTKARRRANTY